MTISGTLWPKQLAVFGLFVVAQHWFHAIHSQSPSRTLGQEPVI